MFLITSLLGTMWAAAVGYIGASKLFTDATPSATTFWQTAVTAYGLWLTALLVIWLVGLPAELRLRRQLGQLDRKLGAKNPSQFE